MKYELNWVASAHAYDEDNPLWNAYIDDTGRGESIEIWEHEGKSYLVINLEGGYRGGIAEIIGPKPMCANCKHCSEPGVRSDVICLLESSSKEYHNVCDNWGVKL